MSTTAEDTTTRRMEDDAPTDRTADTPADETETETATETDEGAKSTGLFDASRYDSPELQITKVDGQGIDKIRIAFTGSIMLDRSDPRDVALFNKLILGKDVELRCAGEVVRTATGWTTNRDGDLDAVVGERTIKVGTVYVLEAESLAAAKAA